MNRSLLVIDDDERIALVLQRSLRDYAVDVATSAEEALERVAARSFDGILCDLALPGRDGIAFFAEVADVRPGQEDRVRFMTGGAMSERDSTFLAHNAGRVLEKPFELERLRRFVRDFVGGPARDLPSMATR